MFGSTYIITETHEKDSWCRCIRKILSGTPFYLSMLKEEVVQTTKEQILHWYNFDRGVANAWTPNIFTNS